MKLRPSITLAFLCLVTAHISSQTLVTPTDRWTTKPWDARWITTPDATDKGAFLFRKSFALFEKPTQFIIHISADNRYRLFVNGKYINEGPQLSDPRHWRFESIDIAPLLQTGLNVVAVQVWNLGEDGPAYQMGKRLGLIVQGDNNLAAAANSDNTWKCIFNPGFAAVPVKSGDVSLFFQNYSSGPMDRVDGPKNIWDWEKPGFNDKAWPVAKELPGGTPFLVPSSGDQRELTPRSIPWMERTYQPAYRILTASGISAPKDLANPLTIGAGQKVSLLIDQRQVTTAFPELIISKGAGTEIKLTYAEALIKDIRDIGHRDSVKGKTLQGVSDVFISDGGEKRIFTTLTWRSFRFVNLEITAGTQPLVIEKFGFWFTAFPVERKGSFVSADSALTKVFNVSSHTARITAHETYMNSPYWERLQYVGDARIQALFSYYVSGDDRLARNAIEQFEWSLQYDGLMYSRYPSSTPRYSPNFSLVWISMVHDFFMYRKDMKFVQERLPNIRRILGSFERFTTADKLIGLLPYGNFLDQNFSASKIVSESENKAVTANTLFYIYALDMAAQMESHFGNLEALNVNARRSQELKALVKEKCWDAGRGLYADSPDKKHFSMQANILAILCNLMPQKEQQDMIKVLLNDNTLTRSSLYFDFYFGRAMNLAGAGDSYQQLLNKWKGFLKLGLTTFPEGRDRGDCSGGSISPAFEILSTLCGIKPEAPGFEKILIEPQLQEGERVKGAVPHSAGKIEVEFTRLKNELRGRVVIPMGSSGRLVWLGRELILKPGGQNISMRPLIEDIIQKKKD